MLEKDTQGKTASKGQATEDDYQGTETEMTLLMDMSPCSTGTML